MMQFVKNHEDIRFIRFIFAYFEILIEFSDLLSTADAPKINEASNMLIYY